MVVKWGSGSPSSGLLQKWASRKRWKKKCTWATPIRYAPYTFVRKFGLKWLLWKLGFQGLLVSKDFKVACYNVAILPSFRRLLNHAQGIRREGGTQIEGEEIQGTLPLYHILSWLYKSRGRLNCAASCNCKGEYVLVYTHQHRLPNHTQCTCIDVHVVHKLHTSICSPITCMFPLQTNIMWPPDSSGGSYMYIFLYMYM